MSEISLEIKLWWGLIGSTYDRHHRVEVVRGRVSAAGRGRLRAHALGVVQPANHANKMLRVARMAGEMVRDQRGSAGCEDGSSAGRACADVIVRDGPVRNSTSNPSETSLEDKLW